jgi:hypothetical protein
VKMVRVYHGEDSILACEVDLEYYATIGWLPEAPAVVEEQAEGEE